MSRVKIKLFANYKYLQGLKTDFFSSNMMIFLSSASEIAVCDVWHNGRLKQSNHVLAVSMALCCHGHQLMRLRKDDHRVCRTCDEGSKQNKKGQGKQDGEHQCRTKASTTRAFSRHLIVVVSLFC